MKICLLCLAGPKNERCGAEDAEYTNGTSRNLISRLSAPPCTFLTFRPRPRLLGLLVLVVVAVLAVHALPVEVDHPASKEAFILHAHNLLNLKKVYNPLIVQSMIIGTLL